MKRTLVSLVRSTHGGKFYRYATWQDGECTRYAEDDPYMVMLVQIVEAYGVPVQIEEVEVDPANVIM